MSATEAQPSAEARGRKWNPAGRIDVPRSSSAASLALLAAMTWITFAATAHAQTALSVLCVTPDITVELLSGTVTEQQIICYNSPSGTTVNTFAGIPAGTNVSAYYPLSSTQTLLAIDTTSALPTNGSGETVTVTPKDVVSYNPATGFYSSLLYFTGASYSVPPGVNIDAISMDGSGNLLLAFDTTIALPQTGGGTLTAKPADLVAFNGATYTLDFNSAAAGIPSGINLVGATMLPNTHLLLTMDESGSVGAIAFFTPTDVLEFDPGGSSWVLSFNGMTSDNWPDGSQMNGVWAAAASSPTPTTTPSATATATPTVTASATATSTSATPTLTATATRTATGTATATSIAPTATATSTRTATPTASATSATPTLTATPTATPTSVAGKLKFKPRRLEFGSVDIGSNKVKSLKITNAGKITKKKHPLPILIESETATPSVYAVTMSCAEELNPRAKGQPAGTCEVQVTFTPTEPQKYSGELTIIDNLEPSGDQPITLSGIGKTPKQK
jgi:hypothetical protein